MSRRSQFTTGSVLLAIGLGLMAYTVWVMQGLPYVYVPVLTWIASLEYAVSRYWWEDAQVVYVSWRRRSQPPASGTRDA